MLSILISIVGIVIGTRTLQKMSLMIGHNQSQRVFWQIFFSISMFLLTFLSFGNPLCTWVSWIFSLLIILFVPKVLIAVFKRRFRENFIEILDQIILEMQSGQTFRSSFKNTIQNETGFIKVQLQDILNQIIFPENAKNHKEKYLQRVIFELRNVDACTVKTIEQLKHFRSQLRQERDFQRKEAQVKESVRAQVIILSVLYFFLSIFVVLKFGFFKHLGLFILSVILFGTGILIMTSIGRLRKWKV